MHKTLVAEARSLEPDTVGQKGRGWRRKACNAKLQVLLGGGGVWLKRSPLHGGNGGRGATSGMEGGSISVANLSACKRNGEYRYTQTLEGTAVMISGGPSLRYSRILSCGASRFTMKCPNVHPRIRASSGKSCAM